MEQLFKAIVDRIQAEVVKNSGFIIGINGLDCSGKTSIANRLHRYLLDAGCLAGILHVDDFSHIPTLKSVYDGYRENGSDETLVLRYYENCVSIKDFVIALADYRKKYTVVIVEGVFLFNLISHNIFDFKMYLDIEEITAFERYKKRKLKNGNFLPDAVFHDIWHAAHLVYCDAFNPRNLSDIVLLSGDEPRISKINERMKWLSKLQPIGRAIIPII
jgi:uridine kinase